MRNNLIVPLIVEAPAAQLPDSPTRRRNMMRTVATGIEANSNNMSCLSQILYPTPDTRAVCACFFTSLTLFSALGATAGCCLHFCSYSSITLSQTLQKALSFPALMGYGISFMCSLMGTLYYSSDPTQNGGEVVANPNQRPAVLGRVVAHQQNRDNVTQIVRNAFNLGYTPPEVITHTAEEPAPVVVPNVTVRSSHGNIDYRPPVMPTIMY